MKTRITLLFSLVVAGGALAACDSSPVTSSSIGDVQVLAVRAEPAGVYPGQAISLTALVASPVENDPDVTVTWYNCQYATFTECAEASDLEVLGTGTNYSMVVPASAQPGDNLALWLDAKKDGEVERALKAVPIVDPSVAPNQNPNITSLSWMVKGTHTASTTVAPGGQLDMMLEAVPAPAEIYFDSNENADETVQVRTYTTGGVITDPSGTGASGALYFTAPSTTGVYGNWTVVVDGRGGVAWAKGWITVVNSNGGAS